MTYIFVTTCFLILIGSIKRLHRIVGRLAIVAPSTIFVAGITGRYGFGSLVVSLTPEEWVLPGEFFQYIVTWRNVENTSGLWLLYIVATATSFLLVDRFCIDIYTRRVVLQKGGFFSRYLQDPRGSISKGLMVFTVFVLIFSLIEAVIGTTTGSSDRGSMYTYWASQTFKPTSGFIAISRLRQIAYLLLPFALINTE